MVFRVGGDWYKPNNGAYIGDFIGVQQGMPQEHKQSDGSVKRGDTVRWQFLLYNFDGTPVVDPKTSAIAVAEGLSSDTVGIGKGVPAKARGWLSKLLEAKGLQFVEPGNEGDVLTMIEQAKGARVILHFGKSQGGKDGTLTEIEIIRTAGVSTPASLPNLSLPPLPPAGAPFVLPAAAPFIPSMPLPASTIPAMPFPSNT